MRFNTHYRNLAGSHAFLSPSKYAWVNYDDEKLERVFGTSLEAQRGSDLHDLACHLIRLGVKLPRTKQTLNMYVNDAIGYRMTPEQILFYSENVYGTADAISFKDNKLRVHDLKTGVTPTSFTQLDIYGALFCLEYRVNPFEIDMEFRIYQSDDVQAIVGDPDKVMHIMEKIKRFDKRISAMKLETAGS